MELEEMKLLWGEISTELEKQKKLTESIIIKMTQAGYRNKINRILIPEAIGSAVCLSEILFILINLHKLNTWYLHVCGVCAALILFILSSLSLKALHKMRSVNISDKNYKQALLKYSKGKIQFVFVQKLSFYLGSLLMLLLLPVMGMLIGGKDMFITARLWLWYAVMFPFFYLAARWVFKSYIKTTNEAENILKELEA